MLKSLIRLYWWLVPEHQRRTCICRESCAQHVMTVTQAQGTYRGWAAFCRRYRRCRSGYRFVICNRDRVTLVLLADGEIERLEMMSEGVRKEAFLNQYLEQVT